jgi:hypothetical protein
MVGFSNYEMTYMMVIMGKDTINFLQNWAYAPVGI